MLTGISVALGGHIVRGDPPGEDEVYSLGEADARDHPARGMSGRFRRVSAVVRRFGLQEGWRGPPAVAAKMALP